MIRITLTLLALLTASSLAIAEPASQEIEVSGAFVRAVPSFQRNSAMFMSLHNRGAADHTLIAAHSSAAQHVELHTHTQVDGMMRMRQIKAIAVAAGATTELKPGGLHVMLIGLTRPLEQGDEIEMELEFDDSSRHQLRVPVRPVMGSRHHHGGHHHGHHGHH